MNGFIRSCKIMFSTLLLAVIVSSSAAFAAPSVPSVNSLSDDATCQAKLVANAKDYEVDTLRSYLNDRVSKRSDALNRIVNGPKGLLTTAQANYNAYQARYQGASDRINQINSIRDKSLNGLPLDPAYAYTIANVTPAQANLDKLNQDNSNAQTIIKTAQDRLDSKDTTRYALTRSICASIFQAQIFSLIVPEARTQYLQTRIDRLYLNVGIDQALYNAINGVYSAKKSINAEYDVEGTLKNQISSLSNPVSITASLAAQASAASSNPAAVKSIDSSLTTISRQINSQKDALVPVYNKVMVAKLPKAKKTTTPTTSSGSKNTSTKTTTTKPASNSGNSGSNSNGYTNSSGSSGSTTKSSGSSSGSSNSNKKSSSGSSSSKSDSNKITNKDSAADARKKKVAADKALHKANHDAEVANKNAAQAKKELKQAQDEYKKSTKNNTSSPDAKFFLDEAQKKYNDAIDKQKTAQVNKKEAASAQKIQAQKYEAISKKEATQTASEATGTARSNKSEADANLHKANHDVAQANKKVKDLQDQIAEAKKGGPGVSQAQINAKVAELNKQKSKAQTDLNIAKENKTTATIAQKNAAKKYQAAKQKQKEEEEAQKRAAQQPSGEYVKSPQQKAKEQAETKKQAKKFFGCDKLWFKPWYCN